MEIFQEAIEQKFVFPLGQAEAVRDWMEFRFARDPAHYLGEIRSVYFDTPSLHLLEEKRNSDYQKTKVRLRWYESPDAQPSGPVTCYLEVKRKSGAVRRKGRQAVSLPAETLEGDLFGNPRIWELAARAFELDYFPPGTLVPVAEIRYRRFRYVDPETGSRLSLDTGIRCLRANLDLFNLNPPVHLDCGVLEQKGPSRFLLASQAPIAALLHKRAFSKYAECLEGLLQPTSKGIK
ncbi:MAG: hypothetical protein JWP91_1747 [Fibrobacteres bacterium]|nr:hypothetical protein [Fibrobacterota bacterium]